MRYVIVNDVAQYARYIHNCVMTQRLPSVTLDNFACWSNWIIQGKKDMEPNTDSRVSIQLNLKPICIIEYGNQ